METFRLLVLAHGEWSTGNGWLHPVSVTPNCAALAREKRACHGDEFRGEFCIRSSDKLRFPDPTRLSGLLCVIIGIKQIVVGALIFQN